MKAKMSITSSIICVIFIFLSLFVIAAKIMSIVDAFTGTNEQFKRPASMIYSHLTDSFVVGGVVTCDIKRVGWDLEGGEVGKVLYTNFGFDTDDGRVITVVYDGALYVEPGEPLGLELVNPGGGNKPYLSDRYVMRAIIWGGR